MTQDLEVDDAQKKSVMPAGWRSLKRGALILIPIGVILTLLGLVVSGPNGSFNVVALVAGLITLLSGILCSIAQQVVHAIVEVLDADPRRGD